MAEKNPRRNETIDALFDAILSLETREECYDFFEDLCTVKEISDMAQRLEAAKAQLGYELDKKKLQLSAPIKELGTTMVPIKLHPKVTGELKVVVKEA